MKKGKDNQVNMDFAKIKASSLQKIESHYTDIVADYILEFGKCYSGGDVDFETVEDLNSNLESIIVQRWEVLAKIDKCESVASIVEILNETIFEGDDAAIFSTIFDTDVLITND